MKAIQIDGKTLEGGGQLVRIILGLSALTRRAVHITNIRANRRNPRTGSGGGLKRQHLTAARWLAETCGARTEGLELSSSELLFQPLGAAPDLEQQLPSEMIALRDGRNARAIFLSLDSQGAMALLLQAILPYLILGGRSVQSDADATPIYLTLEGGTHVTSAPTLSYVQEVLIPNLNLMFGSAQPLIEVSNLEPSRQGWAFGARILGQASFIINPVADGHTLPSFTLKPKGSLQRIEITVLAPDMSLNDLQNYALEDVGRELPEAEEVIILNAEESGQRQRYYVLLVAVTEHGSRIGSDCIWSGAVSRGGINPQMIAREIVGRALKELKRELATGLSIDHHMTDQIAVYMGLAKGVSRIRTGEVSEEQLAKLSAEDRKASLHTDTARWAVQKLLGAEFDEDGSAVGVAFEAGTQTWTAARAEGDEDEDGEALDAAFDALHVC